MTLKVKNVKTEQVVEQQDEAGIEAFLAAVDDRDDWAALHDGEADGDHAGAAG